VFAALAAEKLPPAFTVERGTSQDIIPFAYLGIDDARRGDTAAANASIQRLATFDSTYRFGELQYRQAQIAAQLGQCDRAVAFLSESLDKGTSVYDGFLLEASAFKRIERCSAFEALRVQPR